MLTEKCEGERLVHQLSMDFDPPVVSQDKYWPWVSSREQICWPELFSKQFLNLTQPANLHSTGATSAILSPSQGSYDPLRDTCRQMPKRERHMEKERRGGRYRSQMRIRKAIKCLALSSSRKTWLVGAEAGSGSQLENEDTAEMEP